MVGAKAGDGLPRSERRQRNRQIGLRLTDAEYDKIERRAREAGYDKVTEYVRDAAIRGVRVERRDLGKVIGQLGRIGNNLNQLAHTANEHQAVDPAELRRTLAAIEAAVLRLTSDDEDDE